MPAEAPQYVRLEGWEARVRAALDAARGQPYAYGTNDCFRLACAVVQALTGVDRWPQFAGRYASKAEAIRLIVEAGGDFKKGAEKLFGVQAEPMDGARPGDICEYRERDLVRTPHLGVVWNAQFAVLLADRRLVGVKRASCWHCWRIG